MKLGNPTESQRRETLGNGWLYNIAVDIEALQNDLQKVNSKQARDAIESQIHKLRRDYDYYTDWMQEVGA
jgi:hypothetical protein